VGTATPVEGNGNHKRFCYPKSKHTCFIRYTRLVPRTCALIYDAGQQATAQGSGQPNLTSHLFFSVCRVRCCGLSPGRSSIHKISPCDAGAGAARERLRDAGVVGPSLGVHVDSRGAAAPLYLNRCAGVWAKKVSN
jgi:hypothetical protein